MTQMQAAKPTWAAPVPPELPVPSPGDDAATLLRFAERQARPLQMDISPDGDDRTSPPLKPQGADIEIRRGLHRLLSDVGYPHGRVTGNADELSLATRIESIVATTAPQRFEPRSAVNPHRAYPAAHCFYAARLVLVCGPHAWHYEPVRHVWQPLTAGDAHPHTETEQALRTGSSVDLVVMSHRGSIPSRYRELRWSLVLGEAGHLARLLVEVGRVHGFAAAPRLADPDGDWATAPTGPDWVPGAVVRLTWPGPSMAPRSTWAGSSNGSSVRSWAEVLFERSAGRANKGFAPAPGPLGPAALEAVLNALADARIDVPSAKSGGLDLVLLVRDVVGMQPGRYLLRPGRAPERVGADHGLHAVQDAFAYPVTQMTVSSCPAALVMVGDHRAQVGPGGPTGVAGLRRGQLAAGYLAQAGGLAMAAHGGFLRPARSFDPDALATKLDLPLDVLPSYLGLLGTSSFTDLLLDVRP